MGSTWRTGVLVTQGMEPSWLAPAGPTQRPPAMSQTGRIQGQQWMWSSQQVASHTGQQAQAEQSPAEKLLQQQVWPAPCSIKTSPSKTQSKGGRLREAQSWPIATLHLPGDVWQQVQPSRSWCELTTGSLGCQAGGAHASYRMGPSSALQH